MIIDLDGTVYRGDKLVEHAQSFFEILNHTDCKYTVLTNCSRRVPAELALDLKALGLDVPTGNIVTSACIAKEYFRNLGKKVRVCAIGSSSFKAYLRADDVELVEGIGNAADYVIVGFCTDFTYDDLSCALWHICRGAKFLATNLDETIPVGDCVLPHTGALCAFLERASKQEPINLGKPSMYAGRYFRRLFGSDTIHVVGDRIDTDMLFAKNNGFIGCLVLTGITTRHQTDSASQFYHVFDNLQKLCEFIGLMPTVP